jgi:hypothetical protein
MLTHHNLSNVPGSNAGKRSTEDQDREARTRAVGSAEHGIGHRRPGASQKRKPVADYVKEHDKKNGAEWKEWLQTNRTELTR